MGFFFVKNYAHKKLTTQFFDVYLICVVISNDKGDKLLEARMINLAMTTKGFSVVLQTDKENKVVPILVATIEAQSIIIGFLKFKQERPLSHDLMKEIVESYSIDFKYILIDSVKNDTFTAKIALQQGDNVKLLDSRPSDAIALALRMESKIFIDEAVVDATGIFFDDLEDISLNAEIPFKYENLDKHFLNDISLSDIANASSLIFKKYSSSDKGVVSEDGIYAEEELSLYSDEDQLKPQETRTRDKIEQLLKQALKEERYEDAANYRDELNNYKDS